MENPHVVGIVPDAAWPAARKKSSNYAKDEIVRKGAAAMAALFHSGNCKAFRVYLEGNQGNVRNCLERTETGWNSKAF